MKRRTRLLGFAMAACQGNADVTASRAAIERRAVTNPPAKLRAGRVAAPATRRQPDAAALPSRQPRRPQGDVGLTAGQRSCRRLDSPGSVRPDHLDTGAP